MTLLAIDPSSTKTGYAVMADRMTLIDAGFLKPNKTKDPAIMRIIAMTEDLTKLLKEYRPEMILVERPHTYAAHKFKDAGIKPIGIATYGMAAGAMFWACYSFTSETQAISAEDWTRGVPKLKRQRLICMAFPQYDPEKDRGCDIADAIGLALWWFSQQKANRIAG